MLKIVSLQSFIALELYRENNRNLARMDTTWNFKQIQYHFFSKSLFFIQIE
jgi:hypothetical protein